MFTRLYPAFTTVPRLAMVKGRVEQHGKADLYGIAVDQQG